MEGSNELSRGKKDGDIDKVSAFIKQSVNHLLDHPRYLAWQERANIRSNRYVAINNSFIYRSRGLFKTNKSNKILALEVNDEVQLNPEPLVLLNKNINSIRSPLGLLKELSRDNWDMIPEIEKMIEN